jgi:hypothetical protein
MNRCERIPLKLLILWFILAATILMPGGGCGEICSAM